MTIYHYKLYMIILYLYCILLAVQVDSILIQLLNYQIHSMTDAPQIIFAFSIKINLIDAIQN